MTTRALGFIGLGRMGRPLALRLLDAGHRLTVFDTDAATLGTLRQAGAQAAASPRAVADTAEVVFASLPTPEVLRQVALGEDGVVHGTRATVLVDLSTTGPRTSEAVDQALRAGGRMRLIDCPVSGGVAGAARGTLTLMAAGEPDVCGSVVPLLGHFGRVFRCGDRAGHGQVIKLANNTLSVAAMAACCEALVLGARAGVDPATMMAVINESSGRSNASQEKVPRHILPRSFDFGFATGLSQKDLRLCLDEAEAMGVSMLIGSTARQVLGMTHAAFGAEADFTNMLRVFERLAGVEVPAVAIPRPTDRQETNDE